MLFSTLNKSISNGEDSPQTADTINSGLGQQKFLFIAGVFIGLIVGLVTVSYRLLLKLLEDLRFEVYDSIRDNFFIGILFFIVLIASGILIGKVVKLVPMIKGSGIPQIKGILLTEMSSNWLKETVLKYFLGLLSLGLGLSLGREGPSIQLGGNIGLGFSKLSKKLNVNKRVFITAGAGAGLSAAFNAPLAGVIFSLEELHKSFSPMVLLCVMIASAVADFVSAFICGFQPIFSFDELSILPFKYYYHILIIGVIAGILGKAFNRSLVFVNCKYGGFKKIPDIFKPVFPLILAGILGLVLPEVTGGGHELIESLTIKDYLFVTLVLFVIIKFLFTIFSYSSGAPGGIFLPLLVIGSLIGKLYGEVAVSVMGIEKEYILNFLVLAMAAYFTAIVKAPITGSILITEMTGSFKHLLPLLSICVITYIVVEFINSSAIYDNLLEIMLKRQKNNWTLNHSKGKILIEIPVCHGSEIEFKTIKDIAWPEGCLLVAIKRGEKEIIPNGDTKLYLGDFILIIADEKNAQSIKPKLTQLGEAQV